MLTYAHSLHQATTSRNNGKSKERIDLNYHERLTKTFKIMVKNKSENNSWLPWFGQLQPSIVPAKTNVSTGNRLRATCYNHVVLVPVSYAIPNTASVHVDPHKSKTVSRLEISNHITLKISALA